MTWLRSEDDNGLNSEQALCISALILCSRKEGNVNDLEDRLQVCCRQCCCEHAHPDKNTQGRIKVRVSSHKFTKASLFETSRLA